MTKDAGHLNARLFNPHEIGTKLREISTDLIKREGSGLTSRWLQGPNEVDLFIWQDEHKNIIKQQLIMYGQIVEWNVLEGVRTGFVVQDEKAGQGVKASETIRFDANPVRGALSQAAEIVRNVEALSASERSAIERNFIENPIAQDLNPEEFLRKFGPIRPEPRYGRMRRWMLWLARKLGL